MSQLNIKKSTLKNSFKEITQVYMDRKRLTHLIGPLFAGCNLVTNYSLGTWAVCINNFSGTTSYPDYKTYCPTKVLQVFYRRNDMTKPTRLFSNGIFS